MLNAQQLKAVQKTDGPCLVIAGAGTGKTKTIVEKIAHLINSGVQPDRILTLTFSNEAAAQLKERAVEIAPEARDMKISTFHAFCAEFIREHARECNVADNFTLMEELDAAILLKRKLDLHTGTALRYANTISKAKDLSLSIEDYKRYLKNQENILAGIFNFKKLEAEYQKALVRSRTLHLDTIKNKEEKSKLDAFISRYENYSAYKAFLAAWMEYEKLKTERGSLDYSDLNKIVLVYIDVYGPSALAENFDYVIVDEFQDTNKVQFELLEALTAEKRNITVVGDQNQTVYAFRGAYANNIEKFIKVFGLKHDDIVSLDLNYRSTDKILRTAHKLVTNNYDKPEQSILLHSNEKIDGAKVRIIRAEDNKEQARCIIEEIEALVRSGLAYKDIAVLYRSHSSASSLKRALQNRGLPYSTAGGSEFFYQPEVKAAVSFLYVLNNFSNPLLQADQAWWKLLHTRFGLDSKDSTILAEFKKKNRRPLQQILYRIDATPLSDDGKKRIQNLTEIVDRLRLKTNRRLSDLILEIYEATGLAREHNDNKEAMYNLKEVVQLAETFETFHGDDLSNFVTYLEMVDEMGGGLPSAKMIKEESIKLLTIHASKGLEFPAVFLIDVVKDKFPLTRGGAEPLIPLELNEQYDTILSQGFRNEKEKDKAIKEFTSAIKLKEERRLAYVALTRAKRSLCITLAKEYGGKESREPSQFLFELGADPLWFSSQDAAASARSLPNDLAITIDNDIKAKEGGDTELDRAAVQQKRLMSAAMERRDLQAAQHHLEIYHSLLDGKISGKGAAAREAEKILQNIKVNNPTGIRFNPKAVAFSVTSIGTFMECAKKYELKHILNMPSRDDEDDTALGFGSAIHDTLDLAAKTKAVTKQDVEKLLAERVGDDKSFDFERGKRILDVFWARHKHSLGHIIATEQFFRFNVDGFAFTGKIDRIDSLGDGKVRIIDYKTGYMNRDVSKDDRERQLLLYALAIQHDEILKKNNWEPSELVLDMLEKEKPLEFTLEKGVMAPKEGHIKPVKVDDIKKQIVDTAKQISKDYEQGFPVAETDSPCRFCSYKLYCPKWG